MKIVICGSSNFRKEKVDILERLKALGHQPVLDPWSIELVAGKQRDLLDQVNSEPAEAKKQYNFIRWYFEAIKESDAILVYNQEKKGIKNYVGANTFLEMGYAHVMEKKIYLYYGMPEQKYIEDEVLAVEPICLNGKLEINN